MRKYYVGLSDCWQTFAADSPEDATPEATGYVAVTYACNTPEEAEDLMKMLSLQYVNSD